MSAGAALRDGQYRKIFLANSFSMIGNVLTPIALVVGLLRTTGSTTAVGYVMAAYAVPQVALMLFGGVWADRANPVRLMVTMDLLRLGTQAVLGTAFLMHAAPVYVVAILQAGCGAASAVFQPAASGLMVEATRPEWRQQANSLLSLSRSLAFTIGPLIGGVLVAVVGVGEIFLLDALTFGLSAWYVSRVRVARRPGRGSQNSTLTDLRIGLAAVLGRSWVWTTIACSAVFNLCFTSFQVVGSAQVLHHLGTVWWGVLVAGFGIGQVAGTSLGIWLRPRRPLVFGRLLMFGAVPLLLLLIPGRVPGPLLVLAAGLCGVAMSTPEPYWQSALQNHVEAGMIARVSSVDYFGSFLLRPVGMAVTGVLGATVGAGHTLFGCAVIMAAAIVLSLMDRELFAITAAPPGVAALAGRTAEV